MFVVVSLFVTLFVTLTANSIDSLGHLGGLLTGILCGLWLMPSLEDKRITYENHEKNKRRSLIFKVGIISTIVWFGLFFVLFYTVRKIQK